ncbi:hypothetical protein [Butyricicoccus sp.]|uniref:hypothetical protein n=1 Tax=Butyricicoccus sp. TaxID=2049021 RepID=UPI003F14A542
MLKDLAVDYLKNVEIMEQRVKELEAQAKAAGQLEMRRKLRRRINTLNTMICESRQIAFQLEHYYDKPEEGAVYVKPKPQRGRPKKKFSRYGYGTAAPAAVEHGERADKPAISSLRSAFFGGDSAARNRQ